MDNTDPLNQVKEIIEGKASPRDKAFSTMSDNIWKPSMLKQMNRFDKNQIQDVFKNLVVMLLYEKEWNELTYKQKIIQTKEPPYYKVKVETDKKQPISIDKFIENSSHAKLINDLTELYIGVGGEARKEVFNFITSYANVLERESQLTARQPMI